MPQNLSLRPVLFGMAKLLAPTLLFILVTAVVQAITFSLLGLPLTDHFSYQTIPPLKSIAIEAAGLIPVFIVFIAYKKKLAKEFSSIKADKRLAVTFLKALLFSFLLIGASTLLILLSNGITLQGNHAFGPIDVGFGVIFFIIAALGEEILCRIVYLGLLAEKYGKWNSLIASSLLFMALHFLNPHLSMPAVLNLFLAGVLLGQIFLYSGKNLWFVTVFHMGWNFCQGSLFGFAVSGITIGQSLFLQHVPLGSAWHGKAFGLEGSLECSAILFLSIGILEWWHTRRTHEATSIKSWADC